MRCAALRLAWILMIIGFALPMQYGFIAQEEVMECCSCGDPEFDADCNYVCPDAPWCQCGSAACSEDGSRWLCAPPPVCASGYEPTCANGQWNCSYSGGGGYDYFCPWFDPYCDYCPYWDPYCEWCDYEWDLSCYDCDPFDPSCEKYYMGYWWQSERSY